jgi:histidinol-phosphatase (PHP family)
MKIAYGDSHLHTVESDGKCSVEQVAELAARRRLAYICFTDHYPLAPGLPELAAADFDERYIEQIRRVQEQYRGVMDICFGAEFDWIAGYGEWTAAEIAKGRYDYVLGSVHFILDDRGQWLPVDESEARFLESSAKSGGVENFVCAYYGEIRNLVRSGLFDGLAHLDLIRIFNKSQSLFSENGDWYKGQVLETLDVLAGSKMCMEINTNGWYKRCEMQYPALWILQEARKREIPLTLSSDGHRPEGIGRDLDKACALAQSAGYDSIVRFKNREMLTIKIGVA